MTAGGPGRWPAPGFEAWRCLALLSDPHTSPDPQAILNPRAAARSRQQPTTSIRSCARSGRYGGAVRPGVLVAFEESTGWIPAAPPWLLERRLVYHRHLAA